jgi:ssDNA-binding Zn-finger/Zn-ribbon topoisomerase 1
MQIVGAKKMKPICPECLKPMKIREIKKDEKTTIYYCSDCPKYRGGIPVKSDWFTTLTYKKDNSIEDIFEEE